MDFFLAKIKPSLVLMTFFALCWSESCFAFCQSFTPPQNTIIRKKDSVIVHYDTIHNNRVIVEYDTLKVYDTIYVDDTTVGDKSIHRSPVRVTWFTNMYYCPGRYYSDFKAEKPEYSDIIGIMKDAEHPAFSSEFGAEAGFSSKKFMLTGGLTYSVIRFKADYSLDQTKFNTTFYYGYFPVGQWTTDTIDVYYQIDHNNDTIWHYVTKPVWTETTDSVRKEKTDTLYYKEKHSGINSWQYLEIPFYAGYNIINKRLVLWAKGGIIPAIPVKTSGMTPDPNNAGSLVPLNQLAPPPFVFSVAIALSLNFQVCKQLEIYLEPVFRKNITSVFDKTYPVSRKNSGFSARMGISFKL